MPVPTRSPFARPRRRRRWPWALLLVALLLAGLRLALPLMIERSVNHRLAALPAQRGEVGDIDLALVRGAYVLREVRLVRRADAAPFFSARRVDFALAWGQLFRGRIVSRIVLDSPVLHLERTRAEPDATPDRAERRGWREVVNDLFPIEITELVVHDGALRYVDSTDEPRVDLAFQQIELRVAGLANRAAPAGRVFPAEAELAAHTSAGGRLRAVARGAPLEQPPRFEAQAELDDVALPALNDLLRQAAGVDVSAGTLHVSAEITARGGGYEGYVKPLVRDARFDDLETKGKPLKALWEKLVGAASAVLKNDRTENVGTKIPFSGRFGETDVEAWPAFVTLLRNAFGRALREGVDGEAATSP